MKWFEIVWTIVLVFSVAGAGYFTVDLLEGVHAKRKAETRKGGD